MVYIYFLYLLNMHTHMHTPTQLIMKGNQGVFKR